MSQLPDHPSFPCPAPRPRRPVRLLLLAAGLGVCAWFGRQAADVLVGLNFHAVIPGKVYRGAQPSPRHLEMLAREYGVRTVVNLRGNGLPNGWYVDECRAAENLDLHMEDVGFNATRLPSAIELRRLIEIFDQAEYPIYLHCRRGADRTGLASVVALLLQPEYTAEAARGQLSARFGHAPVGRSTVIDAFFDLYDSWLTNHGRSHAPAAFRQWATEEYARVRGPRPVESVTPLQASARVGEPLAFDVKLKNTGTQAWNFHPGRFCGTHVGYQAFDSLNRLIAEGRGGLMARVVQPGEDLQVTLVAAPFKQAGKYRLLIDLVEERHCWFYQTGSEPWEQELIVRD